MIYDRAGLYIDGAWCRSQGGSDFTVESPATGETLGTVPAANAADVAAALEAAERGGAVWATTHGWNRAAALHRIADAMEARTEEAVQTISAEVGKPLAQSRREWSLSVDQFRWFAEEARRIYGRTLPSRAPGGRIEIWYAPIGVVAAFTAWNFPAILLARKIAPALAAGCSIVCRPSKEAPGAAMQIVECCAEAELPPGVVNLVCGSVDAIYRPIMASSIVRKVSLTGSTEVGKQMVRDSADTLKRVTMELGGNAACIVYPDADIETALDTSVAAKFANAGQVCVAPDRFYVHESIVRPFVDGFVKRAKALKLGSGLDESVQMGPLINADRLAAVGAIVSDAADRGGKILCGGSPPAGRNAGYFFEPTVITGLPDDAKAIADENFGPIAAITTFTPGEDIYARVNRSSQGLASYVFTRDPGIAREAQARVETGMLGINTYAIAAAEAPFGGIKESGMGREGGSEAIADYTVIKQSNSVF